VAMDPQSRLVTNAGNTLQPGIDFLPVSFAVPPRVLEHTPIVYAGSVADTASLVPPAGITGKFVILDVPAGFDRRAIGPLLGRYRDAATVGMCPRPAGRRADRPHPRRASGLRHVPQSARDPARLAEPARRRNDTGQRSRDGDARSGCGEYDQRAIRLHEKARGMAGAQRGGDFARAIRPCAGSTYRCRPTTTTSASIAAPSITIPWRAFNRVVRPMAPTRRCAPRPTQSRPASGRFSTALRAVRGPRPDSIRNGADDDGSGTVAILEIAEAFARASGNQRPRRSILFISHTGEEAGLLGSRWYSDHPTCRSTRSSAKSIKT